MKFVYKHCSYDTDIMCEADKLVLKDVIESFEAKLKLRQIEQQINKSEEESKPVNKLPFDRKPSKS